MSAPDLNPAQHQAVNTLTGPLLVLAGAGSGKTRVITYRIARLIQSGIRPERILAVTFTNKAAKEMRERAVGLLGKRRRRSDKGPEISTFHSLCVRILRRNITELGYPSEFSIYDRGDQESLARAALRDVRVSHDRLRPGDLIHLISGWKSRSIRPEDAPSVAQTDKELLGALAYAKYQTALTAAGAVDFDDLLLLTEELLERFPDVRVRESGRFDHLLIDEYQDTNGLQYRIVKHLAARHRNLCVVGDDDQSIYGWRGAEVTHILNFKNDWPEAEVVRLEANYRSREAILTLANTLIAHNSTRHAKVLRPYRKGGEPPRFVRFEDETAEAQAVVREIQQRLTNPPPDTRIYPSDFAILFRTNEQPRAFEQELRRHQVPYVLVGGQSFYDRKEVRDVLAYLRLIAAPRDEVSLLRVINTPPRGIGASTVKALLAEAVEAGRQLWEVLCEVNEAGLVEAKVAAKVSAFVGFVRRYQAAFVAEGADLVSTLRELLTEVDYKSELVRLYDNPSDVEARLAAIEEVVNSLGAYVSRAEAPSLRGFLEETALTGKDDLKEDDDKRKKEAVTLMTLHSAKGLEYPHVYMVGMEEGIMPHQRSVIESLSVDEERRLAYVGVTRARDTLTLTFCKGRMKWGKLRPSIPSRFIMEMKGETERARRAGEAARAQFLANQDMAQKLEEQRQAKRTRGGKAGGAVSARPRAGGQPRAGAQGSKAPPLRGAQGASKRAGLAGSARGAAPAAREVSRDAGLGGSEHGAPLGGLSGARLRDAQGTSGPAPSGARPSAALSPPGPPRDALLAAARGQRPMPLGFSGAARALEVLAALGDAPRATRPRPGAQRPRGEGMSPQRAFGEEPPSTVKPIVSDAPPETQRSGALVTEAERLARALEVLSGALDGD